MASDLTAEELLAEYEGGRRDFSELSLAGISLAEASLWKINLRGTSLAGADLTNASLEGARLVGTDFTGAVLRDASLADADLKWATFVDADLRRTTLFRASLRISDCRGANMRGAYLGQAKFDGTVLSGARFDTAILEGTIFFDVDVTALCYAGSLTHLRPSSLDARAVMKSYRHPRLKRFMTDCGVPEIFAEYMIECARAVGDDALRELMQSTFISYGGPDEGFARRLYDSLRAHGVVTFFFSETAKIGERIGDEVFNALQRHDRMILVCSRASLDRPGVLNEIQETLDREARDGGAGYLIPVMLDEYLLEWDRTQPVLAQRVKSRVAADFRDLAKFDASLDRLLAALRKKAPSAG